jgi:benzoate-CoA ligase family protein
LHDAFNASTWLIDRRVDAGDGDRVAVRCGSRTFTYSDVLVRVEEVAASLRRLGVRPEERVAMVMLDSLEFVTVFLGAMRIGAVPVPMNPLLPGRDLGVIVEDARARIAFVSAARTALVDEMRAGAPELITVVTTGAAIPATMGWAEFVNATGTADGSPHATWAESPGFWLCTSGSTGQPKLAMHRHGDIPVVCQNYGQGVLGITPADRCFSVGPMFHAYGIGNSMFFAFAVGASVVLEPTRPPTAALVASIVHREKPTLFFCIPTFYAALAGSDLADDTFTSVRYGVSAAERLPAETFERFRRRFGVTILDGIGSTELLHIYISNTPTAMKAGTSGVPVPGYEVRIIDENGDDQPVDVPGQLLVRGATMATGYWCRSATSRATFVGDWMSTGDLYARDADGFHTYLGRVDDMMRVGGEWVSPAEVESVLIEHPTVLEAAVVGEPGENGVLRPVAFVVAAAGTEPNVADLEEHCRQKLAGYKRPKRYTVVADLPKTATGKIQRYKLRG